MPSWRSLLKFRCLQWRGCKRGRIHCAKGGWGFANALEGKESMSSLVVVQVHEREHRPSSFIMNEFDGDDRKWASGEEEQVGGRYVKQRAAIEDGVAVGPIWKKGRRRCFTRFFLLTFAMVHRTSDRSMRWGVEELSKHLTDGLDVE